jgi:hypothetical protein
MNSTQSFVKKFIIKEKQNRYLGFLEKDKTRKKFTRELYHFKDFNWKLFREIKTNEIESSVIFEKLKSYKNLTSCTVISVNEKFDNKVFPIDDAIEQILGEEGTILIFGNADVVYYEAEPFDGRYISL